MIVTGKFFLTTVRVTMVFHGLKRAIDRVKTIAFHVPFILNCWDNCS